MKKSGRIRWILFLMILLVGGYFVFRKPESRDGEPAAGSAPVANRVQPGVSPRPQASAGGSAVARRPSALPRFARMEQLEDLIRAYHGENWIIRKEGRGRVKRILGARIALGETSHERVHEFLKSIAPVFELKDGQLEGGIRLVQDGPTLDSKEGVRSFQVAQTFQGYPVIDGNFKAFVDFASAEVNVIEGADLLPVRGELPAQAPNPLEKIQARVEQNIPSSKVSAMGRGPEVAVDSDGSPKLVYRFVASPSGGPVHPDAKEVWADAVTGKVIRTRPTLILN